MRLLSNAVCLAWLIATVATVASAAAAATSSEAKKLFADPPREYATAPLWVWNDRMTEEEVRGTLRDLASQGVKQAFVHPRPGLMTPYLSAEWFALWRFALDEARKLDMAIWVYDENSYPAGFAGGLVPAAMPESRGLGLVFRDSKQAPTWTNDFLRAVFRIEDGTAREVTAAIRSGGTNFAPGDYVTVILKEAETQPWYAGYWPVNLLRPGVTQKFLELTYEPYRKELGSEFGRRIPGAFSDEPNICPAGRIPWDPSLVDAFQERWGYGLVTNLAAFCRPAGDYRKVRHNFFQLCNDLLIERWSQPMHDYCASNHLIWTGHYWEHEWPRAVGIPDNMAMYAWHQMPGIDCLQNEYTNGLRGQFGNIRMVRELNSVANQIGQNRRLCEIYGAGGWDLRFADMKRIGDWLGVLGVNFFDEHLSYVTLRGARKRDHPQSFSYHEPWWGSYHLNSRYLARLSAALSQGAQVNEILVIEPTTTVWMYNSEDLKNPRMNEIAAAFENLLRELEAAQLEYDLGSEDLMRRHGSVVQRQGGDSPALRIGQRVYRTVVIPPETENLNRATWSLLHDFLAAGGKVLASAEPARTDGEAGPNEVREGVMASVGFRRVQAQDLAPSLKPQPGKGAFAIMRDPGDGGILFHQRRVLADGELLLLVNSSDREPSRGELFSPLRGVESWDLNTGKAGPFVFTPDAKGISAKFELPPCGSLLLFLSQKPLRPVKAGLTEETSLAATGPVAVHRMAPNVLTLDFVDVTAGGATLTNQYCYAANKFAWQTNGFEGDPWDSAVQFKDDLLHRTLPAESGFTASYRFHVADGFTPTNLSVVIERPDLYTITCNGQPVRAQPGDWWLDKAFGRVPLGGTVQGGDNLITMEARPLTLEHALEPAYLLGDFALQPAGRGFVVVPPQPLELGCWNAQGHPFYAQGVAYAQRFSLPVPSGRYVVAAPDWLGSVARVKVNGIEAGQLIAPPWECDVTRCIHPGENLVQVEVIGTLKNTLGPHHEKPKLGSAWPSMFQKAPTNGIPAGTNYATVGYGLFRPFQLRAIR